MRASVWAVPLCRGFDRWLTVYYSLIIYRWRGRTAERELPVFSLNQGWTDCADWLQPPIWHWSPVHPSRPRSLSARIQLHQGLFAWWKALCQLKQENWGVSHFVLNYERHIWPGNNLSHFGMKILRQNFKSVHQFKDITLNININ